MSAEHRPACACCGAPARLLAREGAALVCENCLLDRALPVRPPAEDFQARFAEALMEALDLREHETGLHSKRVACHTRILARRFFDKEDALRQVYWGALLHDLGKIGIPDAILLKQGPLGDEEWRLMRTHPDKGAELLRKLPGLEAAVAIVRSHEERYDGTGYPGGLCGEAIPLGARLFAVIDTLDAMTSDRPYRKGRSFDIAAAEIVAMAGSQFDPLAVEAFLAEQATLREMVARKCSLERFAEASAM
jgi:HD-GYP domain-containing protein (c-di-GMP phosphodiesterase class II)